MTETLTKETVKQALESVDRTDHNLVDKNNLFTKLGLNIQTDLTKIEQRRLAANKLGLKQITVPEMVKMLTGRKKCKILGLDNTKHAVTNLREPVYDYNNRKTHHSWVARPTLIKSAIGLLKLGSPWNLTRPIPYGTALLMEETKTLFDYFSVLAPSNCFSNENHVERIKDPILCGVICEFVDGVSNSETYHFLSQWL